MVGIKNRGSQIHKSKKQYNRRENMTEIDLDRASDAWMQLFDNHNPEQEECPKCHEKKDDIEVRYSFGVYAGKFCTDCCAGYRDNCGVNQPQGSPNDLDEPYDDEDSTW